MEKIFIKDETRFLIKVTFESRLQAFIVNVSTLDKDGGKHIIIKEWDNKLNLEDRIKDFRNQILSKVPLSWIEEVKSLEMERVSKLDYIF